MKRFWKLSTSSRRAIRSLTACSSGSTSPGTRATLTGVRSRCERVAIAWRSCCNGASPRATPAHTTSPGDQYQHELRQDHVDDDLARQRIALDLGLGHLHHHRCAAARRMLEQLDHACGLAVERAVVVLRGRCSGSRRRQRRVTGDQRAGRRAHCIADGIVGIEEQRALRVALQVEGQRPIAAVDVQQQLARDLGQLPVVHAAGQPRGEHGCRPRRAGTGWTAAPAASATAGRAAMGYAPASGLSASASALSAPESGLSSR